MKYRLFTTVALISIISLIPTVPVIADNTPAKTYRPGFWQPAARVNVNRPIEIELINQTDLILAYDLTTNIDTPQEKILAGQTATLKDFPLPAFILINPDSSNTNSSFISLKYDVSVDKVKNILLVKIKKIGENDPGNTTLNIHETGAVYIY